MTRAQTRAIPIAEDSQSGEARRAAVGLAATLGFSEARISDLAIVVTELSTNLIKHGGGGEILLTALEDPAPTAVDVTALDLGAGIRDVDLCMRDGYSTAGTPGGGLGAIRRLADEFDIYSEAGKGTAVFARLYPDRAPRDGALQCAAVRLPIKGETACGDAWSMSLQNGSADFLLADGLGHGPLAATASQTAVRVFRDNEEEGPAELMRTMHQALRSTRGAAAGVAHIDLDSGAVSFCGVGNCCFVLAGGPRSQQMISHNGTLGHQASRFQEFAYRWTDGEVLVMHSDGLSASWVGARTAALMRRHPGVIAGALCRDFRRQRDDITVVVARKKMAHG